MSYKIVTYKTSYGQICFNLKINDNNEIYCILFMSLLIKNMLKNILTKKYINIDNIKNKTKNIIDFNYNDFWFEINNGIVDCELYKNMVKNNTYPNMEEIANIIVYYRENWEQIFNCFFNYIKFIHYEILDDEEIIKKCELNIILKDIFVAFLMLYVLDESVTEYKNLEPLFKQKHKQILNDIYIDIHDSLLKITNNEIKPYFEYVARRLSTSETEKRRLSIYRTKEYLNNLFIETTMSQIRKYYLIKKILQNLDKEIIPIQVKNINQYKHYQYIFSERVQLRMCVEKLLLKGFKSSNYIQDIIDEFCSEVTKVFIIPFNNLNFNFLEYRKETKTIRNENEQTIKKHLYTQFYSLVHNLFYKTEHFENIIEVFYDSHLRYIKIDGDNFKIHIDEIIPPKVIFETFDILYKTCRKYDVDNIKTFQKIFLDKDNQYIKTIFSTISL